MSMPANPVSLFTLLHRGMEVLLKFYHLAYYPGRRFTMIVDKLEHCHRYFKVHKGFKEAFQFIQDFIPDGSLEPKKIQLDGPNLIAIVESPEGRGRSGARLESHRKYIDIQFTFEGSEEIGWRPYHQCRHVTQPYNDEKDIEFFSDAPSLWLPVPQGTFAIFFPQEDSHAPLASSNTVHKIIMKVAIER